ncbi:MAG TPA: glutathione S-transferase family protein [Chthoniobacterales bacterium]|jgi:glutathione S-transferase
MLELYHLPHSICSQKVRICLAEKELPWTGHVVDLSSFEHLSDAYLKINPNGVVPALVHDGQNVIESTVICEYLDEVFPDSPLSPSSALGRASMRAWLRFVDEIPTASVRIPSFNVKILATYEKIPQEELDALIEKMPLRKHFFRRMGRAGFSPEEQAASLDQLQLTIHRIDLSLTDGKWLVGSDFTIADICMAPLLQRMEDLNLSYLWNTHARVGRWLDNVRERPSFAKAFPPGSRLNEAIAAETTV